MKKKTLIISGFPGVGKTVLFNNISNGKSPSFKTILDSDSSNFSWLSPGIRHPEFPQNYMNHIKENMGKVDIILVSSHDVVRKALYENKLEYILVYPKKDIKEEYIQRYKNRNNDDKFINMIDSNWDKFINDIEDDDTPLMKIELLPNEYLNDIWCI